MRRIRPIVCQQSDHHPDPFGRDHKHVGEKAERGPDDRNRVDTVPVPVGGPRWLEQSDEVDACPLDEEIVDDQHPGDRREYIAEDADMGRVAG
jgi:hypothetical protein